MSTKQRSPRVRARRQAIKDMANHFKTSETNINRMVRL